MDDLNRLRIGKACRLLLESDRSVESIALATGFANVHYFFKVFKQCVGMTPGAFRQMNPERKNESFWMHNVNLWITSLWGDLLSYG